MFEIHILYHGYIYYFIRTVVKYWIISFLHIEPCTFGGDILYHIEINFSSLEYKNNRNINFA